MISPQRVLERSSKVSEASAAGTEQLSVACDFTSPIIHEEYGSACLIALRGREFFSFTEAGQAGRDA